MRITAVRLAVAVITTLILAAATSPPVAAQYFGQNKVRYKDLDFKVLKTEHFDIYFYPSEREGVDVSARLAERWIARLERFFGHTLRGRQPLIMYASHTDFEQNNIIPEQLGEGTGGVTEPIRRRIVLPFGGPLADTDHVIGHELVHAFQFDIARKPGNAAGQNGVERLPLWFIEGMAEYLSLGPVDPHTAMWLRDATRREQLPSIAQLDNPKYFPYRWGQAFWAYVGGRWGDDVIPKMLGLAAATGDVNVAIRRVLERSTKELSNEWQADIRRAYEPVLASAAPLPNVARVVVKATGLGNLNVGPAISPDGRWIAFLSERSGMSIDLFVADAASGRIVRKLTSTASDPHYSSLQFIYSAGAWDASSTRLAIATVASGHPALAIFNAERGQKEREIPIPEVDEILNPAWAPDGHAICFSGMSAGLTDLYVYDLNASRLRRLTHDAFADLQPTWSPDGARVAFVTDRFTTNLRTLSIGSYRLALIDPDTSKIEQVTASINGADINPQWAPDGRSLYFVSDRNGIANLYHVRLDSPDRVQLTTLGNGISGITHSSPAMTVAPGAAIAAVSIYEDGRYSIYTLDLAHLGTPQDSMSTNTAMLPPVDRKPSEVSAMLADSTLGLPPVPPTDVIGYKPKLSLEGVGQPMIAVGASRFGAALGGGVSLTFSDMLGDHSLGTVVQFNSGLNGSFSAKDTAAEVAYVNRAHRWNWGTIVGQVPYLSGGFQAGVGLLQGQPVEVDQTIIFRQTERSAAGIVAYPFNRAQRVELQGGMSQTSFDQVVRTTTFDLVNGQLVSEDTEESSLGRSLTLGTSSAALVFDTATFGATSPVQGQRYRLETDPTFGSINYAGVLADYRRYFMPAPFYTLASRVMHYGRYGGGGEDPRLLPLYIGYPTLVRGYDVNSFDQSECAATAASSCPAFDRLMGSRVLVANLELRFPLLRPFGANQNMYGPLPVEVALFADGGVAWNREERPSLLGGSRDGVASAGLAFRVNLFGVAVGELDFARPFQRPGRGWTFQFNLAPGF